MSDALIASLQKRIDELTGEKASLQAENKDRRIKSKKLVEELDTLRKQTETLTTERDTFKIKAEAGPTELNARIAELEGTLRSRDHRDAFAGVKEFDVAGADGKAKKYTLRKGVTVDALWKQLDYKAEGETPKAEVVTAKLGEAIKSHPFLFAETATDPGGSTRPITVQARESGPGGGRGTDSPTATAALAGKAIQTPGNIPGRI